MPVQVSSTFLFGFLFVYQWFICGLCAVLTGAAQAAVHRYAFWACKVTAFISISKLFGGFCRALCAIIALFNTCFGFPVCVGDAGQVVEVACEDEQVVGQTVDVLDDEGVDGSGGGEGDDASFGTAGDGAGHLGVAGGFGALGEDEAVLAREACFHEVDFFLKHEDVFFAEGLGLPLAVFFGGEGGADVEEAVLDGGEGEDDLGVGNVRGDDEAEVGVEFVDGAVGFEACAVF